MHRKDAAAAKLLAESFRQSLMNKKGLIDRKFKADDSNTNDQMKIFSHGCSLSMV